MDFKPCKKSGSFILSAQILTPIGPLKLSSCAGGIHSISFDKSPADNAVRDEENKLPAPEGEQLQCKYLFPAGEDSDYGSFNEAKKNLEKQVKWIQKYFRTPDKDAGIPQQELRFSQFCLDGGTDFDITVWKTLLESVKTGQTTTYAKLGAAINHPNAARAVGTALKKNPILLMIPCHRVIRSDGTLGSFAGGQWNECKEFLSHHEKLGEGVPTTTKGVHK